MPIDPTIPLGFQLPMATQSGQGDSQDMLSRLITLKALMRQLGKGQSLSGMMTNDPNATPTPAAAQTTDTTATAAPVTSAPAAPAAPPPQPITGTTFMHGLTRLGESAYSTDGGKTWLSSRTNLPLAGDIYYQEPIATIGGQ